VIYCFNGPRGVRYFTTATPGTRGARCVRDVAKRNPKTRAGRPIYEIITFAGPIPRKAVPAAEVLRRGVSAGLARLFA
jgi:hypothetical protein